MVVVYWRLLSCETHIKIYNIFQLYVDIYTQFSTYSPKYMGWVSCGTFEIRLLTKTVVGFKQTFLKVKSFRNWHFEMCVIKYDILRVNYLKRHNNKNKNSEERKTAHADRACAIDVAHPVVCLTHIKFRYWDLIRSWQAAVRVKPFANSLSGHIYY